MQNSYATDSWIQETNPVKMAIIFVACDRTLSHSITYYCNNYAMNQILVYPGLTHCVITQCLSV